MFELCGVFSLLFVIKIICVFWSLRDSSNESGATDAVGLSMSMSEIEDPEIKGKKKRGRPGKQPLVCICVSGCMFEKCLETIRVLCLCFLFLQVLGEER